MIYTQDFCFHPLKSLILLISLQDLPGVLGEGAEAVMEEVGNSRSFIVWANQGCRSHHVLGMVR